MKKPDLEKLKGKKIAGGSFGAADRYGKGAAEVLDRKEQRERDREAGLVPFAVKLHADLVARIHEAAKARSVGLSEITAELVEKGLAAKK
jgi:hypothetical protein